MMHDGEPIVRVGIADLKIVQSPSFIRTSGLGSCVGIVIYDLTRAIAGLAHVMLPDSKFARQNVWNDYKYADTAIRILIAELVRNGAKRIALTAKIAGGAEMFAFASKSEAMRIGPRNVEATSRILREEKIPLLAHDTGGNCGRTITFHPDTGILYIRTVQKGNSCI